jgi:hypothetical protein
LALLGDVLGLEAFLPPPLAPAPAVPGFLGSALDGVERAGDTSFFGGIVIVKGKCSRVLSLLLMSTAANISCYSIVAILNPPFSIFGSSSYKN